MYKNYRDKYWAYEILATNNDSGLGAVAESLSSSNIDLNPHQIQAAMFALKSPISSGVILADEVGLGKTIEAGLVLSEYYLRGRDNLIIVCPASLRKQWERELEEKFDIPSRILDRTTYDYFRSKHKNPLDFKGCIICSYNFAADMKCEMRDQKFDLVVIDEAHKLRNLYKGKTKIADGLYGAFIDTKKVLLTATPLQNGLMDIYSLVSFIDPTVFGNEYSFMDNYMGSDKRHKDLRRRLETVLHRTLRKDVLEYIRYTNREALTIAFDPTTAEQELYTLISDYIQDKSSFGIRTRFRTLIVLMIRKLMASSTSAVKGTLEGIKERLLTEQKKIGRALNLANLVGDTDFLSEYNDEFENDPELANMTFDTNDAQGIEQELAYLDKLIKLADSIKVDGKTDKLITGLEKGFDKIKENGGARKAIIFTESQRTMDYLFKYLSTHGYKNKIVTYSGTNGSSLCGKIYNEYKAKNPLTLSGVKSADMRAALIDKFKNDAEIMIATEAGAEGLNLQFCSMLVNYDLPWNPQRVEQRIGRIHRYGQKHDVVIINFINKRNVADIRLYEILQNKFKLFDGVFGASDEILGSLSDGVDFERTVAEIFDSCRTPKEIEQAFDELQERLGAEKEKTIDAARQLVLDNLSPTIAEKLRIIKNDADKYLERRKQIFWDLTRDLMEPRMFVNDATKTFGEYEEQVFNLNTERRFGANYAYKLDFSQKENTNLLLDNEKKALKLKPRPYNPTTEYGRRIIERGLNLTTESVHIISSVPGIVGHGIMRVSVYKRGAPTIAHNLIATFIDENGSELDINPADFFDNITETGAFQKSRFLDMLNHLHDKKLKSVAAKDKRITEEMLKSEIEKLNRWSYEEKNSLKYQIKGLEKKMAALKKKFKDEKVLPTKIKIGIDIDEIGKKITDLQLNSFEKQGDVDKRAAALIAGRKRALKHTAEIIDLMACSFEIL